MTGIMKYKANAPQPHTLPSRSKSQPHDQNLSKSVSVPTHGRQESAANFKDRKLTKDNKRQCTTRGIKHWGLSGYASILPRIKLSVTGQESSPQSPTILYRQPLAPILKRHHGYNRIS